MGEAEAILIDAAHFATAVACDLWRRHTADGDAAARAEALRRRLALAAYALCGADVTVVAAPPPSHETWLARLAGFASGRPIAGQRDRPCASTDGRVLRVPLDDPRAFLLAMAQAARAARGTTTYAPQGDRLERDLFLVAEGIAVDRWLALRLPGLRPSLVAARAAALRDRAHLARLTPAERAVEAIVRDALAADPARPPPHLPRSEDPRASRLWAERAARPLAGGPYRGLPIVAPWGDVDRPAIAATVDLARDGDDPAPRRTAKLARTPRAERRREDADEDASAGTWLPRVDDPHESAEDAADLRRPADRDADADPSALADALADLPRVSVVTTKERAHEVLEGGEPFDRAHARDGDGDGDDAAHGIAYPEWDFRREAYRAAAAIVYERGPDGADRERSPRARDPRHAPLIREVRRRFEALRCARAWSTRRTDGPEIDLGACVAALAERRVGGVAPDRLYAQPRAERRDVAVAVLADVSASTDASIDARRTILDVEKEALWVLAEALDALRARFAVLAFSGEGPRRVTVAPLKRFDERHGPRARAAIDALAPERYTRMGAAVRHATALLGRERARRRLLLVLSDGKPNDVDAYEGRYGVEDTRQAIAEVRAQRMHAFCITVDRHAPAYLPRIFAPGERAVLRRPEDLPRVAVDVVRRLVRA